VRREFACRPDLVAAAPRLARCGGAFCAASARWAASRRPARPDPAPTPAAIQIPQAQSDPLHVNTALLNFCLEHGIVFMSYSLLGTAYGPAPRGKNPVLDHPVIQVGGGGPLGGRRGRAAPARGAGRPGGAAALLAACAPRWS
jgi:hypothetical protein